MAFDPLSETTRKYRRAAVGVASTLIIVQTFKVRITDLPVAGIKIELAEALIPVALTLSLVYVVVSFLVCLVDDLVNFTGGTFVDQHVKESREVIEQAQAEFENQLVRMLKRDIDIRDAEIIAKELARFLLAIDVDHEALMTERIENELHFYKAVISDEKFEAMTRRALATYRPIRARAEKDVNRRSPLKTYWYFRILRVYGLEATFPLALAVLAFATTVSEDLAAWIQRLLVAG